MILIVVVVVDFVVVLVVVFVDVIDFVVVLVVVFVIELLIVVYYLHYLYHFFLALIFMDLYTISPSVLAIHYFETT